MSDKIPMEIHMEIMQILHVKYLLQFRTVSKTWKSSIDSWNFLVSYGVRPTQPSRFLVTYEQCTSEVVRNYPSPLERVSPRSSIRLIHPWFTCKEIRILALDLIFAVSCELRSSSRIPTNLDDGNATLLELLYIAIHDLY
ncbi:F-box domain containing protein [Tanacetum coccineum]